MKSWPELLCLVAQSCLTLCLFLEKTAARKDEEGDV